ncbi:MAG TPA: single-stranded DNA-binding protein [Bacteroidales bacterium]|nr:single-stranded DNA-binding protein [Bacteroidales bacterium]HUX59593.1 single-stranded DNA-binding protein [Bacteroidales bacterium]
MSINKVILVGNVGKDPVIRYFDKGVAKATFPLATSETYTNQQGETITSTEWHNIVLWRALAEVAEKTVKKGAQIYIVGKIKTRSYVDKEGNNKYITEILADALLLLDKKQVVVNTTAQADSGKNEVQDKESSNSSVKEPSTSYQTSNGNNDDFSKESFPKNGSGSNQNEDDLPF